MNDLPPCILRARLLLRAVDSIPGAEQRVYQRIVAPQSSRVRPSWRLVAVALSTFLVGSGAYGLGLLPRLGVTPSTLRLPGNKPPQEAVVALVRRSRVVARAVADHPSTAPAAASAISALPPLSSVTGPAANPARLGVGGNGVSATHSQPTSATAGVNTASRSTEANHAMGSRTNTTDALSTNTIDASSTNTIDASSTNTIDASSTNTTDTSNETAQQALLQSELGRQTADYRDAVAMVSTDPSSALARLMRHRAIWPRSAILHEVDLRIITTLLSMGRDSEARAEARRFLRQYPRSPQASAIQRIAGENRNDTESVD